MSEEFDTGPGGLPEPLPAGETILWQGSPSWRAVAVRVFHVRKVLVYFGVFAAWHLAASLSDGEGLAAAMAAAVGLVPFALAAVGILSGLAWLVARTTVYTVTTQRVVMQIGIALPLALNIPFRIVTSAAVKTYPDGTGEIPLRLSGDGRIAYPALWPHARPWRLSAPEPMLRGVPDAGHVAALLSEALGQAIAAPAGQVLDFDRDRPATGARSRPIAAAATAAA